jgi:hypothetical protein
MKKVTLLTFLITLSIVASAQNSDKFYGIFNRLGTDLSVGTQGVSVELATPLTSYLEVGFGVNVMPGFKVSGDVNVGAIQTKYGNVNIDNVNIKADFSRTTCDFRLNCYPFGERNNLFVSAGFSFGGARITKLKGHSDNVRDAIAGNPLLKDQIYAEIDKYNIRFDDNGDVDGYMKTSGVRPYAGIGYGRLIPRHRVGMRVELGCQFENKPKVYSNNTEVDICEVNDANDDVSKIINDLKVYPVLKVSITGRIF